MKKHVRDFAVRFAVSALVIPLLAGTLGIMGRSADDPEYYVVSHGRNIAILTGRNLSAEAVAEKCGYDADEYLFDVTDCEGYTSVELYKALDVSVTADGETRTARTAGGTVGDILRKTGVTAGENDILSHGVDEAVADGMEIRVRRVTYKETVEEKTIAHGKTYKNSGKLEKGVEKTETQGHDGLRRITYKVTYVDGEEAGREIVSEETVTEPADTVILRGTKVRSSSGSASSGSSGKNTSDKNTSGKNTSDVALTRRENAHTVTQKAGTVRTSSGEELSYSKIIGIQAYAYTAPAGRKTASGAPVQVGIVAMLRSTLPQGTRVYVVTDDGQYTYGPAVVGDVPGGDIVDLFFETKAECFRFGVRAAKVYVLD